jgi:hypothetical protein
VLSLPELRERFDKIIERATSTKEELEKKKIQDENTKKLIDKQKQIINKTFSVNEKYKNFDLNVYMEVIAPILDEYDDLGSPTNSLDNNLKYLEISETLVTEYKKNPKADLSTIIKTKYGKNE